MNNPYKDMTFSDVWKTFGHEKKREFYTLVKTHMGVSYDTIKSWRLGNRIPSYPSRKVISACLEEIGIETKPEQLFPLQPKR